MIKPGDPVTFKRGGVERTEIVKSIGYQSSQPAIYPRLSWWQRAVRKLTPARWRKPILPIREAKPAQVVMGFAGTEADAIDRHHRMVTGMVKALDGLTQ